MNRSLWTALGIAGVALAWIASGWLVGPSSQGDGASQDKTLSSNASPAASPPVASPPAAEPTEDRPAKRVQVMMSIAQPMRATLSLHGQTRARPDVVLRAETDGPVERLEVAKGEVVHAGQPLIRLAAKDRPARLAEAQARLDHALLEYRQASQLARKDYASRTTVASAHATVEMAQATLAKIEEEISDTVITAPFDGVFDENLVEVGDVVEDGSAVGRLVQLDPITVLAEVSERNRSDVVAHGRARVTLIDGRTVDGRISWISKVANDTTRTYRVEVLVPNPDRSIASGMTVSVDLPLKPVPAHLVSPATLTLDDQGRVGVKAVDDAGTVVFYEVMPSEDTPQGVWLTGLPERVRLITVGQDYVLVGGKADPVEEPLTLPAQTSSDGEVSSVPAASPDGQGRSDQGRSDQGRSGEKP